MCLVIINIKHFVMSQYISSVLVVLSPKKELSSEPLVSKVINLCVFAGSTIPQAVHFVNKSPLVKPYLFKYNITSLTFRYSEL